MNAIIELMKLIDSNPVLKELDDHLDSIFGLNPDGREADFMTRATYADAIAKIMNIFANSTGDVHPEDILNMIDETKMKLKIAGLM